MFHGQIRTAQVLTLLCSAARIPLEGVVSVIALLTDFGTEDGYVGAMHGVILRINPRATIVDVCHDIPAQDVHAAAFVLSTLYPYFPTNAIHVVVVDPGVGTERRAIALRTARGVFVAPDNGVLSYVFAVEPVEELVQLTNPSYWLSPLSATFHGRDLFAPVAAHLSLGVPLCQMGPPLSRPMRFEVAAVQVGEDGAIVGKVVHIDRFGNLITNVPASCLPANQMVCVRVADRTIVGPSKTYGVSADSGLLALIGSSGYLEIALRNGSAAAALRTGRGAQVVVRLAS